MKRFYKIYASWFLCLFLVLSQFIVSFADVKSLMIGSSSNALYTDSNAGIMTLDLDESDYSIGTLSTLGTVTNTISPNVNVPVMYFNSNGILSTWYITPEYRDGRFYFSQELPGKVFRIDFGLFKEALPVPGGYRMSFDFTSDFSIDYSASTIRLFKTIDNAELMKQDIPINCEQFSGDIYISPFDIQLSNLSGLQLIFNIKDYNSLNLRHVGGSFAVHFTRASISDDAVDTGMDTSTIDYQNNVSSSLSGLSSSVDTMTDEISGVTEAIKNLQGAMEPHYSNVLTQLHHITEQLHAFYDQIYNNIHLKEYALWQDIKTAIENIDLEVNVNLDKLKTSIDNMSQAIQNKLQSVQDTLTNGFDNSSINQDAAELDQSLQEYEEAEQTVIDQVNDSLNDFEFDSGFEEYTNTIKVFSDFIQDLYEASGGFKVVINLSLMLSIAGIVIGVYRFRDGG